MEIKRWPIGHCIGSLENPRFSSSRAPGRHDRTCSTPCCPVLRLLWKPIERSNDLRGRTDEHCSTISTPRFATAMDDARVPAAGSRGGSHGAMAHGHMSETESASFIISIPQQSTDTITCRATPLPSPAETPASALLIHRVQ